MQSDTDRTLSEAVNEFLKGAKPQFEPLAQYSAVSDAVYVYVRDEPSFMRRIDPTFTLMVSMKDGSVTGCVIKGIRSLVQDHLMKGSKVTLKYVVDEYARTRSDVMTHPEVWWDVPAHLHAVREQELCLNAG